MDWARPLLSQARAAFQSRRTLESIQTIWRRFRQGLVLCGCAHDWVCANNSAARGGLLPILSLSVFCPARFHRDAFQTAALALAAGYFHAVWPRALPMVGRLS